MQLQAMPAKTDAGRAEIESRSRRLQGTLRSLLLLVDGRRTIAELQELARRLNAPEGALQQLLSLELISADADAARPPTGDAADETVAATGDGRYSRCDILHGLMADVVRERLGVRGYLFQLRLERAQDEASLEALLLDLQTAIAKKTSMQGAASAIARIRAAVEVAAAA